MSGSYGDTSMDMSMETAAQRDACMAQMAAMQADAARFMAEHGATVNGGHDPVGMRPSSMA